jgi:MFS family permease
LGLASLGYSIVNPSTAEWAACNLPDTHGGRAVALIGTFFNCGSIISMQVLGFLLPTYGISKLILSFSAVSGVCVVICCFAAMQERNHG